MGFGMNWGVSDLKAVRLLCGHVCRENHFSQIVEAIHPQQFHRCVERYGGDYKVRQFSCWDQFLCLAFAQLTFRESYATSRTVWRPSRSTEDQVWTAVCVYVLVVILKKELKLPQSLRSILQVLSVNVFEKVPLDQLLTCSLPKTKDPKTPTN